MRSPATAQGITPANIRKSSQYRSCSQLDSLLMTSKRVSCSGSDSESSSPVLPLPAPPGASWRIPPALQVAAALMLCAFLVLACAPRPLEALGLPHGKHIRPAAIRPAQGDGGVSRRSGPVGQTGDEEPSDKEAYVADLLEQVHRQTVEMANGNVEWASGVGLPDLISGIESPDTRIQLLHEVLEEQKEVMAARASLLASGGLLNLTAPSTHRSEDLMGAEAKDSKGYCTWEALARSSEGRWVPSTTRRESPAFHSSCPYLKDRYKCTERGWAHTMRWIPGLSQSGSAEESVCRLNSRLDMAGLAERAGRPLNVLILGNSLLRELYETIVCTYWSTGQLQSIRNYAHHDDFSVSVFDHMEVIYEFRDYDSAGLGPWLADHTFGEGRVRPNSASYTDIARQRVDVVITNYRQEHVAGIYSSLFREYQELPPVVYVTHACARGRSDIVQHVIDYPKEMQYVEEARQGGFPVIDLCTMSKAAIDMGYDLQARKKGRTADPHLCLPGPHSDVMGILFQMMAGFLSSADNDKL